MMKQLAKILSFIVLVIIANSTIADNVKITKPESFFTPDIHFFNEEGNKVFLDQFEGKTILLCFWASWCGSCVDELPSLDILQKDFRKLPFEVVAVSEDFHGIDSVKAHFSKYGIRHLKLYHDYKNNLFKAMSVVGLPTTFLINPEGIVKLIFKGDVKWHDVSIREMILQEIPDNPVMPKNSYVEKSLNHTITPTLDVEAVQTNLKDKQNENIKQK